MTAEKNIMVFNCRRNKSIDLNDGSHDMPCIRQRSSFSFLEQINVLIIFRLIPLSLSTRFINYRMR